MEPAGALVADAGVLRTEVVAVTRRGSGYGTRWVYLDVAVLSGLVETMDEAIRYRIEPAGVCSKGPAGAVPREAAALAGPTCYSADVLYTTTPYLLPADLAAGDLLDIHAAGAYTATYKHGGVQRVRTARHGRAPGPSGEVTAGRRAPAWGGPVAVLACFRCASSGRGSEHDDRL